MIRAQVNSTVRLTEDLPDQALSKGAVGVILMEFSEPDEAYEVEFIDEEGHPVAEVVLKASQFVVVA